MQTVTVPMEALAEVIALQLKKGGRARLTVTGSSMMPMLYHRRDSVTLVPATGQLKKGDVIFYRRENGQYVLHRIIALSPEGYVCSGDNQAMREPVTREQVLAVVDGFTRKGKSCKLDGFWYRMYKTAWVELFFLRPGYVAIRRRLGRLRAKLCTKN